MVVNFVDEKTLTNEDITCKDCMYVERLHNSRMFICNSELVREQDTVRCCIGKDNRFYPLCTSKACKYHVGNMSTYIKANLIIINDDDLLKL